MSVTNVWLGCATRPKKALLPQLYPNKRYGRLVPGPGIIGEEARLNFRESGSFLSKQKFPNLAQICPNRHLASSGVPKFVRTGHLGYWRPRTRAITSHTAHRTTKTQFYIFLSIRINSQLLFLWVNIFRISWWLKVSGSSSLNHPFIGKILNSLDCKGRVCWTKATIVSSFWGNMSWMSEGIAVASVQARATYEGMSLYIFPTPIHSFELNRQVSGVSISMAVEGAGDCKFPAWR